MNLARPIASHPRSSKTLKDARYIVAPGVDMAGMARALTEAADGGFLFSVVGCRRSGKTSFLLALEDFLAGKSTQTESRWACFPLYVSCRENRDLGSLYLDLLDRFGLRFPNPVYAPALDEPVNVELSQLIPESLKNAGNLTARQLLDHWSSSLSKLIEQLSRESCRIVLLIDDTDLALQDDWGRTLFIHLKTLLTDSHSLGVSTENLAVVLAGSSEQDTQLAFSGLERKKVSLRPLSEGQCQQLITEQSTKAFAASWSQKIFRATGGQPWLVDYVMQLFFLTCGEDEQQFADQFQAILDKRFWRQSENVPVLEDWYSLLPERGPEMLANLCLMGNSGASLEDLAQRMRLSPNTVKKYLRPGLSIGFLSKSRGDRYFICKIFENWFLKTTGGHVLLHELQQAKEELRSKSSAPSAKPFSILVSLDHDLLLADGFYTLPVTLARRFSSELSRLVDRTRDVKSKKSLSHLSAELQDVLQEHKWFDVLDHYVKHLNDREQDASLILRTPDEELLDLPIELLEFERGYLGLRLPIFREIAGLRRDHSYHLGEGCLPAREPINVLLVAVSKGGQYGDIKCSDLPNCEREIQDIYTEISESVESQGFELGKVVVLNDDADHAWPDAVHRMAATPAALEQALKGDLGCKFHLLHFCGHYVFNEKEEKSGLLFSSGSTLELFHLIRLNQALKSSGVRCAFFNSCNTGLHRVEAHGHYLGAGFASVRAGVPVVIGMRWPVADTEALEVSRFFYRALIEYGTPEVALWQTRLRAESRMPESTVWAAPVMITC